MYPSAALVEIYKAPNAIFAKLRRRHLIIVYLLHSRRALLACRTVHLSTNDWLPRETSVKYHAAKRAETSDLRFLSNGFLHNVVKSSSNKNTKQMTISAYNAGFKPCCWLARLRSCKLLTWPPIHSGMVSTLMKERSCHRYLELESNDCSARACSAPSMTWHRNGLLVSSCCCKHKPTSGHRASSKLVNLVETVEWPRLEEMVFAVFGVVWIWYWIKEVGSCDFWMVSWCMVDLRCKVPLWPQVAASFCEAWSIGLGWQYVFRSGLNWYASVFDCWTQICCQLISSACMVCVIVMSVFGCIWFFNKVWTRCFCWTHWFALIWLSEFNLLVMWFTTDMLWWFCDWIPLQLRFGSLS